MKKAKYSQKDALITFSIINIAIGLLNKMNKNLRQQSYLLTMFVNGMAWFALSIIAWSRYPTFERVSNWMTEIPTFVGAVLLMVAIKKSHQKAEKYKHWFNLYCGLNMLVGAYWFTVDVFTAATYSSETIVHWAFMTDAIRFGYSYIMLAFF